MASRLQNVIDLFAGAGGLSLGAARAGFNIAGAVELDEHALETHKRNFPHSIHLKADISLLSANEILSKLSLTNSKISGIIGGPPCQGFSTIGHGNVNDPRNTLFERFFELVQAIQPDFYLAENVPGILNQKYCKIRAAALSRLTGYDQLPPLIIKADEYGAPTIRTRVFFIGIRRSSFGTPLHPEDFYAYKVPQDQKVTVDSALQGLPAKITYSEKSNGKRQIDLSYLRRAQQGQDYFHSRVVGCIPESVGDRNSILEYLEAGIATGFYPTKHSAKVRARYEELAWGQRDKISGSSRLDPNGFCPTLRAGTGPDRGSYQAVRPIHPVYPRVITVREAARLQGFPDWFCFSPTIWHSFRQIGNSVSPLIAEKVLSVLFRNLHDES